MAIRYLNSYLEQAPRDAEALEMRSKLLAELARDGVQVKAAIDASEYLVRLDPDGPGRAETRRRLTELYLRMEQFVPGREVQYRTAATLAEGLIKRDVAEGKPEARDHLLLGRALLGRANLGEATALPLAVAQFEEACAARPGRPRRLGDAGGALPGPREGPGEGPGGAGRPAEGRPEARGPDGPLLPLRPRRPGGRTRPESWKRPSRWPPRTSTSAWSPPETP